MKSPTLLTALALVASATFTLPAQAELIYGLTSSSQLVSFDSASPGTASLVGSFSGLGSGQTLVGIDFRPLTGELYALGYNGQTEFSQLYTVNLATAALSTVGSGVTLTGSGVNPSFGFDFNPVADRLRIVTSADTNYRFNPSTGALAFTDTTLGYATGDPNQGANPFVVGAAYTNNFAGATSTTLYGLDAASSVRLITIGNVGGTPNSPNGGQLFTVGSSGFFLSGTLLGFDISATNGTGYVVGSLNAGSPGLNGFLPPTLFRVNLANGSLTSVGNTTGFDVVDLAVFLTPVPEPGAMAICAAGLVGAVAVARRRRARA